MRLFDLKVFPEFRVINDTHQNIVFDVVSTALLQMDDVLLDVAQNAKQLNEQGLKDIHESLSHKYASSRIEASWKALSALVSRRLLQPLSSRSPIIDTSAIRMNAILLNVAHSCQLACTYCFAEGGHYGRPEQEKVMPWRVAKAAIDMLDFIDEDGYTIAIAFFGGEPLLNWEVVERTIRYAKERAHGFKKTRVIFNMTTNAIGLTPSRAKFLRENDCRPMISIDGGEAIHNMLRPAKDAEKNSWQGTIEGVRHWNDIGGDPLTARATITAKDVDISSMVDLFRGLGFGKVNTQVVQTEDPDLKLSPEQLHLYEFQQLRILHDNLENSDDFQRVYGALRRGRKRNGFCGVGYSSYAVEPNGDIFLCHRFASDAQFQVGNVFAGLDEDKLGQYRGKFNLHESLSCSTCWARHVCGGGCYAENFFSTGDPLTPHPTRCHLTKFMLYHSIEYLALHGENAPLIHLSEMPDC